MPRLVNILAVDDKPSNLTALEAVLQGEFNVIRANSGPEALDILKVRRDIDIILMDVQMPMLDGFETATYIKQLDSAKDIPIVFITAVYHDDPWVRKGYEVGGVDYISSLTCFKRHDTPSRLTGNFFMFVALTDLKRRSIARFRPSSATTASKGNVVLIHDVTQSRKIKADFERRISKLVSTDISF
jgi:CheY-like chemotaxis protein